MECESECRAAPRALPLHSYSHFVGPAFSASSLSQFLRISFLLIFMEAGDAPPDVLPSARSKTRALFFFYLSILPSFPHFFYSPFFLNFSGGFASRGRGLIAFCRAARFVSRFITGAVARTFSPRRAATGDIDILSVGEGAVGGSRGALLKPERLPGHRER